MKSLKHIFCICILSLIFFQSRPHTIFALDDAIIAVVNDELITLKDMQDYTHSTYVSLVAEGVNQKDIEKTMLDLEINGINKLIDDKIILSHAKKSGIIIREKLIDERIEKIKAKYPTEQDFLDGLVNNGATITDLRNKIRDQLMIKFIVEHEIKSKLFVNPQEVTDYYQKHMDQFQKKERLNLDSIFISWSKDRDAERKKASEALDLIHKGQDFNTVGKKYSTAPSLGTIERGQLMPEIEEKVFQLKEGEISFPVETSLGIYIFKANNRQEAQVASLKEVNDQIYNQVYQEKFKGAFDTWLAKLKKNAYIEIKK